MRVVVFDQEMREPLTVVDVSMDLFRRATKGQPIRFRIPENFREWMMNVGGPTQAQATTFRVCTLRLEPIYRGDEVIHWNAIPDDEQLALLLRAAFLPGQISEVQRREAKAFLQGLLS